MSSSPPSQANHAMLAWARTRAGYSIETASEAIGLTSGQLNKWESGSESPSFSQLERIAKKYKYPVMVFYLPYPPTDFQVVKDFRRLPSEEQIPFSPILSHQIRIAQERQSWASSYLRDHYADPVSFVGEFKESRDVNAAALFIRNTLGVSLQQQAAAAKDSDSLSLWRQACEINGVLVFMASGVDVSEMRGFALSDEFAPTIVLNAKDSDTAKTFTLIHELAHILIGNTAVTGCDNSDEELFPKRPEERFCNEVAAETLVPLRDIKSHVRSFSAVADDESPKALPKRYRVSREVVLLRLFNGNLISEAVFTRKIAELRAGKPASRKGGGGIQIQTQRWGVFVWRKTSAGVA